ncbi:MAG TPA: hypothetical protein VFN86_08675 [Casimicrobiaceae bacterium]|jgi:hypothetical protein|nr:hypothetical protein [Casimicrobiaceae bacterium]
MDLERAIDELITGAEVITRFNGARALAEQLVAGIERAKNENAIQSAYFRGPDTCELAAAFVLVGVTLDSLDCRSRSSRSDRQRCEFE